MRFRSRDPKDAAAGGTPLAMGFRPGQRRTEVIRKSFRKYWELYLLVIPVIAYFAIFHYWPMYGVQIAFKDFSPRKGIWDSAWVGMKYFRQFCSSYYFTRLISNTLTISLQSIISGFIAPVMLALMLNEVRQARFKRIVQTVTYAPNFLSTVVMVGMLNAFLAPQGMINNIAALFGAKRVAFLVEPAYFRSVYILSGIWQGTGFGSIIYLAALAGIDPQLHEAAAIDGATRMQRIWHINLPCILPTIVILLILNFGSIMSVGFEKIYLLQNDLNLECSDVISTYVYRAGLLGAKYSFGAAVGLFNSAINLVMLVLVNWLAKRLGNDGLW